MAHGRWPPSFPQKPDRDGGQVSRVHRFTSSGPSYAHRRIGTITRRAAMKGTMLGTIGLMAVLIGAAGCATSAEMATWRAPTPPIAPRRPAILSPRDDLQCRAPGDPEKLQR